MNPNQLKALKILFSQKDNANNDNVDLIIDVTSLLGKAHKTMELNWVRSFNDEAFYDKFKHLPHPVFYFKFLELEREFSKSIVTCLSDIAPRDYIDSMKYVLTSDFVLHHITDQKDEQVSLDKNHPLFIVKENGSSRLMKKSELDLFCQNWRDCPIDNNLFLNQLTDLYQTSVIDVLAQSKDHDKAQKELLTQMISNKNKAPNPCLEDYMNCHGLLTAKLENSLTNWMFGVYQIKPFIQDKNKLIYKDSLSYYKIELGQSVYYEKTSPGTSCEIMSAQELFQLTQVISEQNLFGVHTKAVVNALKKDYKERIEPLFHTKKQTMGRIHYATESFKNPQSCLFAKSERN